MQKSPGLKPDWLAFIKKETKHLVIYESSKNFTS